MRWLRLALMAALPIVLLLAWLRLGSLPTGLLEHTPFGQVRLSISGRNLYYYAPNANFDPDQNTQGAGNIRGLEVQGAPNTRNYGANLRFTL